MFIGFDVVFIVVGYGITVGVVIGWCVIVGVLWVVRFG